MRLQGSVVLLAACAELVTATGRPFRSRVTLNDASNKIARNIRKCLGPPPPTVYFPLNFRYGFTEKVTTDLVIPGRNDTIKVCFDQGSESYWLLDKAAVYNWGCDGLFCLGPCNVSATPAYDYSASPDASKPVPFEYFSAYGDAAKFVVGDAAVEDTMTFVSVSGQRSTIPGIETALIDAYSVRGGDDGKCTPQDISYDQGILGIAPYRHDAEHNTTGPHPRQHLLEKGTIKAAVQSMWMDKRPSGVNDTYTGGALFGGIDLTKFTGPLVKVRSLVPEQGSVGYYVAPPTISFQGKKISTASSSVDRCLVDSGTRNDALPIGSDNEDAFYEATGLVESPNGWTSWPGECDSVPSDVTLDLKFPGMKNGTSVDVKIPLKNYVRWDSGEKGLCRLNINLGSCTLAAPFSSAAFFAADDERGEIAFAQGGISEMGSGPSENDIVLRIP
ncbi:acid protease [Xylariaceae sp. FL1019]|nr:acid protease [Xylariaceae sp. FL1019]